MHIYRYVYYIKDQIVNAAFEIEMKGLVGYAHMDIWIYTYMILFTRTMQNWDDINVLEDLWVDK